MPCAMSQRCECDAVSSRSICDAVRCSVVSRLNAMCDAMWCDVMFVLSHAEHAVVVVSPLVS